MTFRQFCEVLGIASALILKRHETGSFVEGTQDFNPESPLAFLRECSNVRTILKTDLFDADWYRERQALQTSDPRLLALHYLRHGLEPNVDPGPFFHGADYLALNPDVAYVRKNPLLHYENHGRRQKRPRSKADAREPVFPSDSIDLKLDFPRKNVRNKRMVVFASFSEDGRISDTVLYYLRALATVSDAIVFIADNPILPNEARKLDGLVVHADFRHHGEYDFGSYRRGFEYARAHGLLQPEEVDELVLANDSCVGPVFPFAELFASLKNRRPKPDFWGLSQTNLLGIDHIQSFFYVFGRPVLDSKALDEFLAGVGGHILRGEVITRYELRLTEHLAKAGFVYETLVPAAFYRQHHCIPTSLPLTLMRKYKMPLLKRKALQGDSLEDLRKVRAFVARVNPAIAALLPAGNNDRSSNH